jgi:hypothetical protein
VVVQLRGFRTARRAGPACPQQARWRRYAFPEAHLLCLYRSWQNCRVTGEPDDSLTAAIADELTACRQRGIERLDVGSHNQSPVQAPVLERLASEYVTIRQVRAVTRIPQLKYLFRDAIKAFAAENEADAQLVGDLFFGDSQNRVTKSAGELLDLARKKSGYSTDADALFRRARHDAFASFARFLVVFVDDVRQGSDDRSAGTTPTGNVSVLPKLGVNASSSVPLPEVQRHSATTGYVDQGQRFVQLLAESTNATIIGVTNEKLASLLHMALERKRAAMKQPDACWGLLRIVFLSDKLLDFVNDERREFPDPAEVLKQRRWAAVHGRRTVNAFLRRLPAERWATYESAYYPPLFGTLFEMAAGQPVVQLLIRRPQRSATDHLYLQFEDTQGHYFSAAFDEIVHSSTDDNKVIPVGFPADDRFRVTSTRFRQHVLKDGSQATGWLPLVLILTWRKRNGRAEPLLQLRTRLNAARELDRLSHLSGHIQQEDLRDGSSEELTPPVTEFGLADQGPLRAALRRIQMETGQEGLAELRPHRICRYLHPDKENLLFFVYSGEFPVGFQPPRQAELYPVTVAEQVAIRENQTLRRALLLCEFPPARATVRTSAFEIAALNLIVHGHAGLAERLTRAADTQRTAELARVASEIRELEEQTRQTWPALEQDTVLQGLAGLQYREFFSLLLPFYSNLGIPGAADLLKVIDTDERKRSAAARLSGLYQDESAMEPIQLEL